MVTGLLIAIMGGAVVGVQNIFNTRVSDKSGMNATTTLVLALGFLGSMIIGLFVEGKDLFDFQNMKTWYWFSGLIGIGVVTFIVKGFNHLGPTYAMSIVLISQLLIALVFDAQGLLGVEQVPLTPNKLAGAVIIIAGILVFKFAGHTKPDTLKKAEKV